jgi:hypothetical protein
VAVIYRNQGNAYYRDDQQNRAYARGQIVPYDVNGAPPVSGGSGGTTTNALTFNSSGAGAASGSAFDGSAALTISYNSIGAQPAGAYLTGNQTITLSGDLSGSGATAIAATIANGAVSLAKMANMATASLIYRKSAGSGAPEVNSLATLKTDLGLTGTNSGDQTITLTGDVTGSGTGSFAATIAAGAVTLAKMANVNSGTVFYRKTAAAGAPETQTLATLKTDLGLTGTNSGDQTITLTGDVTGSGTGSFSATISANAVTFNKLVAATAAGFVGALAAGNFGQLTGTQATTLLDTFTSALKGLVPASGGGTTNFLRADGTWAAPVGTPPGGSDGQLQYKNGAAFAGAARLVVDASGNLEATDASTNTTPAVDTVTLSPQRIAASGGRTFPRWQDESGIFSTLQPHLGRNSIMQMQSLGAAIAPTIIGGTVTFLGTVTARNPATTNRATRSKRTGQVSAATAGSTAGFYTPSAASASYTLGSATALGGGGFLAVFRWVESDAATVAGAHMFVGLRSAVVAPIATVSPGAFTNCVGVAQLNGGANLTIVFGGSAAQTGISLGANFPAAGHSTDIYELILYAPPNLNNQVAYRVERINTGDVASGVLTAATPGTQLPANTTFLGPTMFRSNNATALAVGLDIVGMYVESDI